MSFTHFDEEGRSRMVDVTAKTDTVREATAKGRIIMKPETLKLVLESRMEKGNVFEVARVAGIMAVKKTGDLIPMCHPLNVTAVDVYFYPDTEKSEIEIEVTAKLTGKTGIEMEALTGVSVAALTIYDMCKAVDKGMVISDVRLMKKIRRKKAVLS
ncbi:MAG: cyclic pyranopterin monophosphate synthase MoaC [Geovibrio sp.]|nr:cyclic pyranopterin monophosphate synthase MoaC [Geovibrio sp.]